MQQLSKYFNSELSETEQEEITKRLLENHFDDQSKARWRKILETEYKVSATQKNKAIKTNLFVKIGMIAASVAFVFLIGNFFFDSSNQHKSKANTAELLKGYLAEKYDPLSLKKSPREDDLRTKAINAYVLGDYEKAINYFDQISMEGEDYVFKGLSYLYTHQPERAIPSLQKAIDLVPFGGFRVSEEIRWQLSLAYLKNEQDEKAIVELKRIANNKFGKRQKDAEKLLSSFDN